MKMLKFLERFERIYPRTFWLCALLGALLFNQSVKTFNQSQITQTSASAIIEKNTALVLAINSGGGEDREPNYFVPPNRDVPPSNSDRSSYTGSYYPKPRYPFGIDPSYNPGGSGGSGGSALPANQIPENGEWVNDPYVWDKAQDNDCSTSEEE